MAFRNVWVRRTVVLGMGLACGLAIAEFLLSALGIPHFHKAHSASPQFKFLRDTVTGKPVYVNTPSATITFQYDSNPRGYFKPGNFVYHETNALGFRGPEFSGSKPAGTIRLLFFGDSFTFGEGVHFEDTFAEVTRRLLAKQFGEKKLIFESYNLGVGGYNTADELSLLRRFGQKLRPDAVILCYVLNDAEPSLFAFDPGQGPVRRAREAGLPEGQSEPTPPETPLYRSRIAQLIWQAAMARQRSRQTESYYLSLYRPEAADWRATRDALHEFAAICRGEKLPLIVMVFPILHQLNTTYPFREIHRMVAREGEAGGAQVLDLLPAFEGNSAEQLWVHPTDQHPNEKAHRIAAEQLAAKLESCREFLGKIDQSAPPRQTP